MYKKHTILGLIPARGGSKGIPEKNIRKLAGKPLIAWTIEAARKSRYLDRVIVNTDSPKIAACARAYGAKTPFMRPKNLAQDSSRMIDVILHTLSWCRAHNTIPDIIALLQPTSPLRTAEDIDRAIRLLCQKGTQAVISVCKAEYPPYWTNTLPADRRMNTFIDPRIKNANRQELPEFYRINGAIYFAFSEYLLANKGFVGKKTFAYIMPQSRSIDIDSEIDCVTAASLLKQTI